MQRSQARSRPGAEEAALIERGRRGDRAALEALLDRHDQEVLNVAYRLLGHPDDALDIRQQAYLNVCRSIERFNGRSSFRTWVLRIVINLCRDHARRGGADRRRVDGLAGQIPLQPTIESPGAQCDHHEQATRVADAVVALPAVQREVLVLRHYHDMSLTAAAEVLEIPLSTAASRLTAAMGRLREMLAEAQPSGCGKEGVPNAV